MKNLAIFLGGVAAGALAGILLAPEKGAVTRECLCDRVKYLLRKKGILTDDEVEAVIEAVASAEKNLEKKVEKDEAKIKKN